MSAATEIEEVEQSSPKEVVQQRFHGQAVPKRALKAAPESWAEVGPGAEARAGARVAPPAPAPPVEAAEAFGGGGGGGDGSGGGDEERDVAGELPSVGEATLGRRSRRASASAVPGFFSTGRVALWKLEGVITPSM